MLGQLEPVLGEISHLYHRLQWLTSQARGASCVRSGLPRMPQWCSAAARVLGGSACWTPLNNTLPRAQQSSSAGLAALAAMRSRRPCLTGRARGAGGLRSGLPGAGARHRRRRERQLFTGGYRQRPGRHLWRARGEGQRRRGARRRTGQRQRASGAAQERRCGGEHQRGGAGRGRPGGAGARAERREPVVLGPDWARGGGGADRGGGGHGAAMRLLRCGAAGGRLCLANGHQLRSAMSYDALATIGDTPACLTCKCNMALPHMSQPCMWQQHVARAARAHVHCWAFT